MRSVNLPDDPAYARFRFDAAREFPATATQLVVSGQIGDPRGDFAAQLTGALDALVAVLDAGGYTLAEVARLGIYTTDVDLLIANWPILRSRFEPDAVPPNTLLPVVRLANARSIVEIEALAVH
jgi:enamine deaminase RidA (YjgF/YER057c/UK114 family)